VESLTDQMESGAEEIFKRVDAFGELFRQLKQVTFKRNRRCGLQIPA